ncbi:MAG: hypothetical protein AAFW46_01395 [Pseudomonadota bacterium]
MADPRRKPLTRAWIRALRPRAPICKTRDAACSGRSLERYLEWFDAAAVGRRPDNDDAPAEAARGGERLRHATRRGRS